MASLIELAAQRLEQLRSAGVSVPEAALPSVAAVVPAPSSRLPLSLPEAAVASAAARALPEQSPGAAQAPTPRPVASSRRIELNVAALDAAGIVTPSAPRSALADQYRVIKRPLIRNATGPGAATRTHGNLIMVTSALPGEGKSFTAVNLAMSIAAELDHTVMLVDADVARPSVPAMLGFEPGAGLLDVLEGKAEMSAVLLRTNVDKLTILPSGNPHPRATELLASEAMRQLLDDIATRYADRIVIFDSPPLLLTTESRVLAAQMGQIVVVVQAERTLQSSVEQALVTIESCPLKFLVLNQARSSADHGGSYGYNYGPGYAYGYGADRAPPTGGAA